MRLFPKAIFVSVVLMAGAGVAHAQSAREPLRAQVQLRAVDATPTLDEALADPEVQSALREHVQGLDLSGRHPLYGGYPLTSPTPRDTGETVDTDIRRLSEGDLRAFESRGERLAPRRARPDRQDADDTGARDVPRGPGSFQAPDNGRPYFDVELFGAWLQALFQNNVNGYVVEVRQHGQAIYSHTYNWAQRPEDANLQWTTQRRQHVASISKFITAMGLAHMIEAQGISFDTPIIDYLPDYWQTGPNIESITFAHLMNHISGFHGADSGTSNFILMRSRVGQGVPANDVGNWATADYENMNFGLCRILMAVLGGYVDADATFGQYNDVIWNWISINAYADYIDQNVFAPAGVSGAVLANTPDSARAYAWDDTGPGWDSEILINEAGGAGWHLSVEEALDITSEFRRGGGILTPQQAQQLLNVSFGLNSPLGGFPAPTGNFYYKMGRWWNGPPDAQAEQAVVMVLPEDMELAVFVNSPLGPNDLVLQDFIGTLYLLCIVEN